MREIIIGDKVRCVDARGFGFIGKDNVYTVTEISTNFLTFQELSNSYPKWRFQLEEINKGTI